MAQVLTFKISQNEYKILIPQKPSELFGQHSLHVDLEATVQNELQQAIHGLSLSGLHCYMPLGIFQPHSR